LRSPSSRDASFSFHLVEQTNTPVCFTAVSLGPAMHQSRCAHPAIFTRCGLGAVGSRDGLRGAIIKVRIVQVLVLGARLHLVQAVTHVGRIEFIDADSLRRIRPDRHHRYTLVAVIVRQLLDAGLLHRGDRAVIARENNHQNGACRVVAELMGLAVHSGKFEIRRG
jgi:hypothetical protein